MNEQRQEVVLSTRSFTIKVVEKKLKIINMKIVQSYWSKPGNENCSWLIKEMHYYCWALSCLKLKQFYDKVELVTDKKGKEVLIDQLGLPYDSVKVVLDDINDYSTELWALGKIYAYQIQDEPFIHVDGDICVWDKFPERIESAGLIAQHEERDYEFAIVHFNELLNANLDYYPKEIIQFRQQENNAIVEANAGIFGGNDIEFIKDYCEEAFRFVNKSMDKALSVKHSGMFNTVFEQYLFYCMANQRHKKIDYLFEDKIDTNFEEMVRVTDIPYNSKFIHLLSYHKKPLLHNQKIMQHLWYEFPKYYERVNCMVKDNRGL